MGKIGVTFILSKNLQRSLFAYLSDTLLLQKNGRVKHKKVDHNTPLKVFL